MSRLGIWRLIGVPSVWPSKTPDRIFTVSVSFRWVTRALWPGARRSRSGWMSASDSGRRGGQPSTTAPMAAPCDSPHVVTRNRRPQVLPTRRGYYCSAWVVDGTDRGIRCMARSDRVSATPERLRSEESMRLLSALIVVAVLFFVLPVDGAAVEILFGGVGRGSSEGIPGSLVILDQTTAAGTFVGHPDAVAGLTGLAFDSTGGLFGTAIAASFGATSLIRIDP